jgi:short-subunit dehydrogenase
MLSMLLSLLSLPFSATFWLCVLLFSPVVYIILNNILPFLLPIQNLRTKYDAKWALITGSSSGIGKELSRTLLAQGLDVILVARDEPLFAETVDELVKQFPGKQVLRVNANLSDPSGSWMDNVKDAVGDKEVQCIFLNAGYIVTGMFEQNPVGAHLANLHCNLTSNIFLSHFFYERMLKKELRGCIVLTSSSASYIPNPFAVMYGATKSGVSAFAASLACEARSRGIHVHSIHPSPVNSRFTKGGGNEVQQRKIEAMDSFYKFATGPEALPLKFIQHIGRGAVVADIGSVSVGLRLVVHLLGYNFMAFMTACTAHLTPDYRNHVSKAKKG